MQLPKKDIQALKFTVGLPVYDRKPEAYASPESQQVVFTVMSLLTHHRPFIGEVVIVDNNPQPNSVIARWAAGIPEGIVRYVAMPAPTGTMPPKNRCVQEARFEHVVVIDSHVLLHPGFFGHLSAFYQAAGRDCKDLLHGPIMTELGYFVGHHLNDQWRGQMWGTWGKAFVKNGRYFSPIEDTPGVLQFASLDDGTNEQRRLTAYELADLGLIHLAGAAWPGHEQFMFAAGARHPDDAFTIPGMGMGMFAVRKDGWLPFHADARGFGGEEMVTGVRYRRAGRRVWCIPGARWWHYFDRPYDGRGGNSAPYRLTVHDKIRNYFLEFQSLGLDVTPLREHFVPHHYPLSEWNQLTAGHNWPVAAARDVTPGTFNSARPADMPPDRTRTVLLQPDAAWANPPVLHGEQTQTTGVVMPDELIDKLLLDMQRNRSGMSFDLPALHATANLVRGGRIVEAALHASGSTVAFLAARPASLVAYNKADLGPLAAKLHNMVPPDCLYQSMTWNPDGTTRVPDCDMLFYNMEPHSGPAVYDFLNRQHSFVSRLIAIHGTTVYGAQWNHLPGALAGVRAFVAERPEWRCVHIQPTPLGLLVLSRSPADGPAVLIPESVAPVTPAAAPAPPGQKPPPGFGPGTELRLILEKWKVKTDPVCDCVGTQIQMDIWGVEGCRARFNTLVGTMRDNVKRWGWEKQVEDHIQSVEAAGTVPETQPVGFMERAWEMTKIGARAAKTWLFEFKFDPRDPWPGIITEAIRRAEEKGPPK